MKIAKNLRKLMEIFKIHYFHGVLCYSTGFFGDDQWIPGKGLALRTRQNRIGHWIHGKWTKEQMFHKQR